MTTSILKPNYKANNYHKLEEEEEEEEEEEIWKIKKSIGNCLFNLIFFNKKKKNAKEIIKILSSPGFATMLITYI